MGSEGTAETQRVVLLDTTASPRCPLFFEFAIHSWGDPMEMKRINATDLRIRTREIVEEARFRGAHYVIYTFGKPVAVLLGVDEYRALLQSAHKATPRKMRDKRRRLSNQTSPVLTK